MTSQKVADIRKKALKESVFDTLLALPLNFLISYLSISLLFFLGIQGPFYFTILQTLILTFTSIIRKFLVRTFFIFDK